MADIGRYFTLSIPWVPAPHRTEWHPTEAAGPFATLSRGAFATISDAIAWAASHLQGAPYTVVLCTWSPQGDDDGAYTRLNTGEAIAAADAVPPSDAPPPAPPATLAAPPEAPTFTHEVLPPLEAPAPAAPPPTPALDFSKLSPRAVADARGYRARRGSRAPSFNVIQNHYGLSRDRGHLGPVPGELNLDALAAYARIFRAVCGDTDVRVPEAELPRTQYRIRIGGKWLVSLVCKPGGAVLANTRDGAGLFDGPVRLHPTDFHGPATTVGLARQLLKHDAKAWCEPTDGGPGFWSR